MRPDWPVALPVTGVRLSMWRAATVYRVVTLGVALYLIFRWRHLYTHAWVAVAAGASMIIMTGVLGWLAVRGRAHHWAIVAADMVLTAGLTLLTLAAQTPHQLHGDMPTLTTFWAAGPALEAGILLTAAGGIIAGLIQYGTTVIVRGGYDGRTLGNGLLVVIAGGVAGYLAVVARKAENELRAAAAERAAVEERERLTREIHDGVLQILGLVHRVGRTETGQWHDIAQEAARQETALRALMRSRFTPQPVGVVDLADVLRYANRNGAQIAAPGEPVLVPAQVGSEIAGAVRAALDNVAQHAGQDAQVWVLLEELPGVVHVTIRDDGVGMEPNRLEDAAGEGRLGVAASIRARITDLGGTVTITSKPGRGTVVEISVPTKPGVS